MKQTGLQASPEASTSKMIITQIGIGISATSILLVTALHLRPRDLGRLYRQEKGGAGT